MGQNTKKTSRAPVRNFAARERAIKAARRVNTASKLAKNTLYRAKCAARIAGNPNSLHIFTDGGCKTNPGPAGSGVCIYIPMHLWSGGSAHVRTFPSLIVCAWKHIGVGTNNRGELTAIRMALQLLWDHGLFHDALLSEHRENDADDEGADSPSSSSTTLAHILWTDVESVEVYTDSQYCVGALTTDQNATKNVQLIKTIRKDIANFEAFYTIPINIGWIKAHCGIAGNELADALAGHGRDNTPAIWPGCYDDDNGDKDDGDDIAGDLSMHLHAGTSPAVILHDVAHSTSSADPNKVYMGDAITRTTTVTTTVMTTITKTSVETETETEKETESESGA